MPKLYTINLCAGEFEITQHKRYAGFQGKVNRVRLYRKTAGGAITQSYIMCCGLVKGDVIYSRVSESLSSSSNDGGDAA